jgi:hypothetical protein
VRVVRARQAPLRVAPRAPSRPLQAHADSLGDLLSLLALARLAGMRPTRAATASARLLSQTPSRAQLARIASRLRAWLIRQRDAAV